MSRPKRLQGVSYVGLARYFLTFCVLRRRKVFTSSSVVDPALLHFRQSAKIQRLLVLAYCFMPDHVHLLVEGTHLQSDLRAFVGRAKQHSGADFALKHGGRLWQPGYYDRVLRQDEDARRVARYIVNNPVRAGLVVCPRDYPFVGSDMWTIDELLESI